MPAGRCGLTFGTGRWRNRRRAAGKVHPNEAHALAWITFIRCCGGADRCARGFPAGASSARDAAGHCLRPAPRSNTPATADPFLFALSPERPFRFVYRCFRPTALPASGLRFAWRQPPRKPLAGNRRGAGFSLLVARTATRWAFFPAEWQAESGFDIGRRPRRKHW